MRPLSLLLPCVAALAAAALPGLAKAAEPSFVTGISSPTFIAGAEEQNQLGWVKNAGDVNGDSREDLLAVVSQFAGLGSTPISRAYVVFGDGTDAPVDLDQLGDRGFVIHGPIEAVTSFSGAPAGDVNGDGLDDIIVVDQFATATGRTRAGRVFVVFGKADTNPVDAAALGSAGFEVIGSQADAFALSTSHVEDLTGDGRDELLVNEPGLDRATVIYGRTATTTVDLGAIGSGGYRITGPATPGLESANRVGDVNGDGLDDLGFTGGCGGASCPSGRTWISFGKSDTSAVNLSSLGTGGFTVTGNGLAGVGPAGDVNGDAKADVAVSEYNAHRAFVVFGRSATTALSFGSLGTAGFRISSTRQGSISPAGDVDGDGRTDLLATSTLADNEARAAVVFGKSSTTTVDLTNILDSGFAIEGGVTAGGAYTTSFASGPRIAVAFPLDSPLGRERAGSVRLLTPPAPSFEIASSLVYTAGGRIALISPSSERRSSPMTWTVTPALPDGLVLDPQTGQISGTPLEPTPARTYTVRATDRLGYRERPVRIRIDDNRFETVSPRGVTIGAVPTFTWQRASAADNTEPVSSYRVVLDDRVLAELPASRCGATECSVSAPGPIGDGAHRWRVETTARDGHTRRTSESSFTVAAPPSAALALTRGAVHTGEPVGLDASQSSDPNGGIARIEFDLDGDGRYETDAGADPRRSTSFAAIGDFKVGVRVTDVGGLTATASAVVHVTPAPPTGELGVSINDGAIATSDPNVTVSLVWPRLSETALVSNDGGFGAAGGTRSIGLAARIPWTLASSGPERLPKIVYVRFRGGEAGRETYTDDIILDQRPPRVATTSLVATSRTRTARAAASRKATLRVTGKDDNAGVREVVVAKRRGGKPIVRKRLARANARGKRTARTTVRVSSKLRKVYVRVTDVAGNTSKWKAVRRRAR